jgi:hypothetical protein
MQRYALASLLARFVAYRYGPPSRLPQSDIYLKQRDSVILERSIAADIRSKRYGVWLESGLELL